MGQSIGPSFLGCTARLVSPGGRVWSSRGGRRLRVPGVLSGAPPRRAGLHSLPALPTSMLVLLRLPRAGPRSLGPHGLADEFSAARGLWRKKCHLCPALCGAGPLRRCRGGTASQQEGGYLPRVPSQCRVPQVGSAPRIDRRFLTPTPCYNYAKVSIWLGGGLRDQYTEQTLLCGPRGPHPPWPFWGCPEALERG